MPGSRAIGKRFGTVVVLSRVEGYRSRLWIVKCDCGAEFRQVDKAIKTAGGACEKCSPYRVSKKKEDFKMGSDALTEAPMPMLARMAQRGSDSALVEFVRRVMHGSRR
jgi:hypothetical protein